ncbi:hypothetical protein ASF83_08500 [Plantibacter sp. Leaf171]|jgi:hypothetical protein|uniref:DUF6804 family protein n=1 Tax=unclassified Plantibacter TaxID=2624265 RepID=UPI0006FC54EA|nr:MULTISPECIES: DUF6804 family protein [unclassified Plantibacter]KQM15946.1 hypothetical protein ASE44_08515 [Plantibacter sp. Leaf1]KQQ52046.1 hypothetical protein ASF68_06535 [Plantibacter sp. Leaf314]KQR59088.1 hypothetical protein ASF83_08500 [Plantibacter sp. Leaf171]
MPSPTPAPAPFALRPALIPGILGAVALMLGLALLELDAFTIVRFVVSILALIMAVFAWQAKQPLWMIPTLLVAIVWNPVIPFPFSGIPWVIAQFLGGVVLVAVGILLENKHATPPAT